MRVVWCACLLGVLLAGCAEETTAPEEEDDTDFDDVQVEVDDENGAILGVVVNDAIVPIEGAQVTVLNTAFNDTTDAQGRFAFSKVPAGTYFLKVTKAFHDPVQSSVDVTAGDSKPDLVRVQLNRLFQGEPYLITIPNSGFFTCTQAGVPGYLYSSSPCHAQGGVDLDDYGIMLEQKRTFHSDVNAGWQTQLFEMQWEPSATGTSERMGIVVSTYKPERTGGHQFAEFEGGSPLYGRLDCNPDDDGECTPAPTQDFGGPEAIPSEGWTDMSYFMSVRPPADAVCAIWCVPPGVAVDQSFDVWLTQAYYQPLPEGWSFIDGSSNPFG